MCSFRSRRDQRVPKEIWELPAMLQPVIFSEGIFASWDRRGVARLSTFHISNEGERESLANCDKILKMAMTSLQIPT